MMSCLFPDYLVLSKTKLDNGFLSVQFSIPDYKKFKLDLIDIKMEVA